MQSLVTASATRQNRFLHCLQVKRQTVAFLFLNARNARKDVLIYDHDQAREEQYLGPGGRRYRRYDLWGQERQRGIHVQRAMKRARPGAEEDKSPK